MHKIDGVSLTNTTQYQNVKKPLKTVPNINATAAKDADGDNDVEAKESVSAQKMEKTTDISNLINVKV